MELTENYAKEISFGWGFTNMLKQIEYCGRICYRSENNKEITRSTALDFVNRMIASKHLSVLEHGTVYSFWLEGKGEILFQEHAV